MGKLPKRLFPKKFQATTVKTKRFDPNVAGAYNSQRSRATLGSKNNVLPNLTNNFMEQVPRTRSLTTFDEDTLDYVRSERGKVVDRKHLELEREAMSLLDHIKCDKGSYFDAFIQRKISMPLSTRYHCLMLKEYRHTSYKLMVFFSGDEYVFVQEYEGLRMISSTYKGTTGEAVQRYKDQQMGWCSKEEIKS